MPQVAELIKAQTIALVFQFTTSKGLYHIVKKWDIETMLFEVKAVFGS